MLIKGNCGRPTIKIYSTIITEEDDGDTFCCVNKYCPNLLKFGEQAFIGFINGEWVGDLYCCEECFDDPDYDYDLSEKDSFIFFEDIING